MVRKRVWLGVLIIVLVVFIPFVYAYNVGFVDSPIYETNSDIDDLVNGNDFQSEFLSKYVNGLFYNTNVGDPTYSKIINTPTLTYSDDNWDSSGNGDNVGQFLYGYIYLLEPITQDTFIAGAHSFENGQQFCTDVGVMWYPLPGNSSTALGIGSTFEDYLSTTPHIKMLTNDDPCDENGGGWKHKETVFKNTDNSVLLNPGVYFFMVGFAGHADSSANNMDIETSFNFAKFNNDETYADTLTNAVSTTRTPFIISPTAMDYTDLNLVFTKEGVNLVENTSWLCSAAGGQMFTEVNTGFVYNSSTKNVQYGTDVDVGFDTTHLCCGNTPDEYYVFNYVIPGEDINTTYVCENKAWTPAAKANETCKTLIETKGFGYDNFYKQLLNLNNVPYYLINTTIAGTDGCCGDDSVNDDVIYCGAKAGVLCSDIPSPSPTTCDDLYGCNYNYYLNNCDNGTISNPGQVDYICSHFTTESCLQSTLCGFKYHSLTNDYGYINPSKNFMCYDVDRGYTSPLFNWTDAALDKYYIKTVHKNVSGTFKEVDVISNSKNWSYCDATGHHLLNGINISEGGTFANANPGGEFLCADMISALVGEPFADSCNGKGASTNPNAPPYKENCCQLDFSTELPETKDDVKKCTTCFFATPPGGNVVPDHYIPQGNTPNDYISEDFIDKEWCVLDPIGCLEGTSNFNPSLNCSQQSTNFTNYLCNNATSYCVDGLLVRSADPTYSPTNQCCFGVNAQCKPKPNPPITSDQECKDFGGKVYSPGGEYDCSIMLPYTVGSTQKYCCIGELSFNFKYVSTFAVANTSFLCFKEDNNDMFSQCCYDSKCRNIAYQGSEWIVDYDRRVLTKGSSIHTIQNYDQINLSGVIGEDNSLIKDFAKRYPVNTPNSINLPASTKYFNLASFSYLEFDMLTNSQSMSLIISGQDLGNLSKYMIGYHDGSQVWHHVIIPLNVGPLLNVKNISEFKFYDSFNFGNNMVILDNIQLTANASKSTYSTKNYYCTGGFSSWIDDLDSKEPLGTISPSFNTVGPYQFACSGLATFGWTGTQCCGDDTKLDNYGEFFNDSSAGCFNGSTIKNNQRLSDVLGVNEFANLDKDRLQYFEYADLLYYNKTFVGCQVPSWKYTTLKQSVNGTNIDPKLLFDQTNNNKLQCEVVGDYYCMNGVWRKKILTNDNLNPGEEFPNTNISLKMAPGGPDLIKNGFTKGCTPKPSEICDNNIDDDCDFEVDESDCENSNQLQLVS